MSSLTETAYYTRRAINWGIVGIIAYIILRMLWGIVFSIYISLYPPKAPPPNNAFNKLPVIKFPAPIASPSGEFTYKLETIEGTVPSASESARVYFMPKKPANLLAITTTQDFASRLNFDATPIQETKNIYRFVDKDFPLRQLRYDIISDNFIIRYGFEQDKGLFVDKDLPFAETAKAKARGILQTYNLSPKDIQEGQTRVLALKLIGNILTETTSVSQADAVRVDFYRKYIDGLRIVTPNPNEGAISIIFSGSKITKKQILQLAYTYWPVDYETYATYGLKPSLQAWQELQNGAGYIAQYPIKGNTAVIRKIYLGYFDSLEPQTYLQPVFIFEGDDGFMAYVSAVAPPWTE